MTLQILDSPLPRDNPEEFYASLFTIVVNLGLNIVSFTVN